MNLLNAAKILRDECVPAIYAVTGWAASYAYHARVWRTVVIPFCGAFSQRHPRLRIRHVLIACGADLIAERFDVAIRRLAGRLPFIARRADIAHHSAGRRAAVARPPPRVVALESLAPGGMDYS